MQIKMNKNIYHAKKFTKMYKISLLKENRTLTTIILSAFVIPARSKYKMVIWEQKVWIKIKLWSRGISLLIAIGVSSRGVKEVLFVFLSASSGQGQEKSVILWRNVLQHLSDVLAFLFCEFATTRRRHRWFVDSYVGAPCKPHFVRVPDQPYIVVAYRRCSRNPAM